MERHITDHSQNSHTARLPRYLKLERMSRIRGPHHAINVLRRLPRGAGDASNRMKSYLELERHGAA